MFGEENTFTMTALIAVIALVTAIVVMATKIVELLLTVKKHKTDAKNPAVDITASTQSKPTNERDFSPLWFRIVALVLSLSTLIFLVCVPPPSGVLTRQDVAWIGLMVATYVVVSLKK